ELKARFDERRNIEWSRKLERVGVHVVYGFPALKIHLKTTLVVRREGDNLRRYVHIGTGNYHAINARIYEDFGFFKPQACRKILVAPFNLRERLIEEIRKVAAASKRGKPGRIQIKVNALTD